MDRETVEHAIRELQAQGKQRPSVREVLGLTGGRTQVVADLVKSILGTSTPDDAEPLRDYHDATDVQVLRAHEAQRRERLVTIDGAMIKHRNLLDSGPGMLRTLWRKIRLQQAHEHDVAALKASWADHEEQLSRLQAEADEIREELEGLSDAIADVEHVAKEVVKATMRADEQADLRGMLASMDAEIDSQTRMYHRHLAAAKQFGVGGAGLSGLWNSDACRLQRGLSLGDRFTLGGPFLARYNQVRKALELPEDRGIHTKESQAAYETIMAEKAAHDALPAVMEHRRRAEAYQKEREAERAADQRAHVAATQQAVKDAQRR